MVDRRLADEQVRWAREARAAGSSYRYIARRLGLSPETVREIATGRTYRDVGGPITPPKPHLSARERRIIRRLYQQDKLSIAEIMWVMEIGASRTIYLVLDGED